MPYSQKEIYIPSNDVTLEASVYQPTESNGIPSSCSSVAIIAHPYGFLGGTMHDPVVLEIASQFAHPASSREPTMAIVYNTRGTGSSSGRASWTSNPEKADYEAVVAWGIEQLMKANATSRPDTLTVYCCGYSYGSLLAPFTPTHPSTSSTIPITYHYLLISPPLSVTWALLPFKSGTFLTAVQSIFNHSGSSKILAISGDQDQFSSSSTFEKWQSNLVETSSPNQDISSRFQALTIPGADHFWRSRRTMAELLEVVDRWIKDTIR